MIEHSRGGGGPLLDVRVLLESVNNGRRVVKIAEIEDGARGPGEQSRRNPAEPEQNLGETKKERGRVDAAANGVAYLTLPC